MFLKVIFGYLLIKSVKQYTIICINMKLYDTSAKEHVCYILHELSLN